MSALTLGPERLPPGESEQLRGQRRRILCRLHNRLSESLALGLG
jgi:hypothetical protein